MSQSVRFTTKAEGTVISVEISCHHSDGSCDNEVVHLNKDEVKLNVISKELINDSHFNLSSPTEAHFLVEGLDFALKLNGDLCLSGEYEGDLNVGHQSKVVIAKDQSLKVGRNFFLRETSMFENSGKLEVGTNWICLFNSVYNCGTIIIKQGWQILALQNFENTTTGKISILRCDVLSSSKIHNNGELNCILDFNGDVCDFENKAGEVHIGGNCSLKKLMNKSEMEPTIGGFVEIGRKLLGQCGEEVQPGNPRYFLINFGGELKFDPKDNCNPGNYQAWLRDICLGCRRVITSVQSFTRREGKRSSFCVQGHLKVNEPSVVECSSLWASSFEGDISLRGYATMKQHVTFVVRNTYSQYFKGNFFGGGGRTVYWDNFVHEGTQNEMNEFIQSNFEVLGEVKGKVQTFINGGINQAQQGVVKTTEEALTQLQRKIQTISTNVDIFPMLVDAEGYEAELKELKEDPAFATMIRRQERCRERSEASSTIPSRCGSPDLKKMRD